jgi:SLT domain-containing protein
MGNGGLVTNPTHALIGETGQPEAVLNPTQTRILRENILSNRPNSLINLLKSYNEAYQGLPANAYDSISNNSNTMQIDKAEVNLHIDKLANDYDSR